MITIAVSGKGGVGKTTIAAGLARALARSGRQVIALDMDPSPNLHLSLGCGKSLDPEKLVPLTGREDLILERTGAAPGAPGSVFRINPVVSDIPEKFGIRCLDNVLLLVLGTIRTGGGGCFCPANAFAKRLVDSLRRSTDVLVMDMEAGVEHLGRGTTKGAEILLVVVEPGRKSFETARQIAKLARDLGIPRVFGVLNKVKGEPAPDLIRELGEAGITPVFALPYDEVVAEADREGVAVSDLPGGGIFAQRMSELARVIQERSG
ncbi:MAG: AAA family ATPase [Methanoregulaceae archaeon]|nr:AAA family ATPase [Methanoregulaceae archaeon]